MASTSKRTMVVDGDAGSHEAADKVADRCSSRVLDIAEPAATAPSRSLMDESYQRGVPQTTPTDSPPSYETLLDPLATTSSPRRRQFNIQPRLEEGCEVLPCYSSAISVQNVFLKKMELEGAVHKAQDRNWYRVLVTLQGTALTLHKYKGSNFFGRDEIKNSSPDSPLGTSRGIFLRSYSLQHADVGIAADYLKKRYVIRVRAEADQFLLSCCKIETLVLWLQQLFAAIDIAPPLDDREIPRDLSVPRRTRRRRTTCVAVSSSIEAAQEEGAISPSTSESSVATSPSESLEAREVAEEEEITSTTTPTPALSIHEPEPNSDAGPSAAPPEQSRTLFSRARLALNSSPHLTFPQLTSLPDSRPNPSVTPDGKWRPQHHWTHFYDMMYAKRCMAILTHRSPRKSNLVIMKGRQWIVDWATGALTTTEPPPYGEVEGTSVSRIGRENVLVTTGSRTGLA